MPASGEQGMILPAVTLSRRDELQRTVAMVLVVPADAALDPAPRTGEAVEGLGGPVRLVLEGREQRLGVRVVVAHRRSAERGHHAEALPGREQGGALHWRAVVRRQHPGLGARLRGAAPR
jgi:hypothetical protein